MSLCIIFNPAARGEKAQRFREQLQKVHHLRPSWALKPTDCAGAARRLATEAILNGCDTIVAAGGDGTINEVVNGMGDVAEGFARARLGILPLGTENVFARELRIPIRIEEASVLLENGRELALDLGRAEYISRGEPQKRFFIQLAGAGLDARAVELVDWNWKKRIGSVAYVVAALKAFAGGQSNIQVDNGAVRESAESILIGNGKLYGWRFPLFYRSELQDGLLDAVVFSKLSWPWLPLHLGSLLTWRLFRKGAMTYMQGKEFVLKSDRRVPLQLDGEAVGELPATISVVPMALRVLVPERG